MPSPIEKLKLRDFEDVYALYLIADLRRFSQWARKHQADTRILLRDFYTRANEVFPRVKAGDLNRRVVKLLGDGVFVVDEYNQETEGTFTEALSRIIRGSRIFLASFYDFVSRSTLKDRSDIRLSFGLSAGHSWRFHLPGLALDYVGERINFASRLCGLSNPSELVVEYDLRDHIESLPASLVDGLQISGDCEEIKSYDNEYFCRITNTETALHEHNDLRGLATLKDRLKQK